MAMYRIENGQRVLVEMTQRPLPVEPDVVPEPVVVPELVVVPEPVVVPDPVVAPEPTMSSPEKPLAGMAVVNAQVTQSQELSHAS